MRRGAYWQWQAHLGEDTQKPEKEGLRALLLGGREKLAGDAVKVDFRGEHIV